MPRRELLFDPRRQAIEGDRDVVDALRQQLQRVQVAARRLPAAVHDQDVVAQFLGLAEDLRGQHDRAPVRGLAPELVHHATLEDRIHAGRELVEEDDRRLDHEDLRDLHAAAEAAAQVLDLAVRFGREAEVVEHALGARPDLGVAQAVKAGEGRQVVADRQEQLHRGLLDDDRDPPADVERRRDDVVAEDRGRSGRRPRQRRQNLQQRRLAGAVGAEEAEDGAARHVERQAVERADVRLPAAGVQLDEITDTDGRVGHVRTFGLSGGAAAAIK